jgi:hypothetical protein
VNIFRTRTLIREWMALLAILAMVLGPLALVVNRSITADERVQIVAGLRALPICAPGDAIDDLAAKTGGGICEHCLPGLAGAGPAITHGMVMPTGYVTVHGGSGVLAVQRALIGLPPATGPPILLI